MGTWSFKNLEQPELVNSFQPVCMFCHIPMTAKNATMYKVQMTGVNDPDPKGRAIDIVMICPDCHYVEAFGVALSQDEAKVIYG